VKERLELAGGKAELPVCAEDPRPSIGFVGGKPCRHNERGKPDRRHDRGCPAWGAVTRKRRRRGW
jgi:hypothetical protein